MLSCVSAPHRLFLLPRWPSWCLLGQVGVGRRESLLPRGPQGLSSCEGRLPATTTGWLSIGQEKLCLVSPAGLGPLVLEVSCFLAPHWLSAALWMGDEGLLVQGVDESSLPSKLHWPPRPPQLFLLCPSQFPPPSDDSGSQPPRVTGQRPWLRQTTDCGRVSAGRRRSGLTAGGYQGPPLAVPCVLDARLWLRLVLWSQEGGCSSRCHTGSHPLSRPRKPFQEHSARARHLPVTGRRQGHPGLHWEGSSQSLIQLGLCQQ